MIVEITSLESQYSRLNAGLHADIEAFQQSRNGHLPRAVVYSRMLKFIPLDCYPK